MYLVRHVEVEPVAGVPPHEWLPTDAGLAAARRLAQAPVWRDVRTVATSPEPKARATAEPLARAAGVPLRVEPDLREVVRGAPPALAAAEHRDRVRRYLGGGDPVAGWEARDRARDRFAGCVRRLLAGAPAPLATVSHGTILALYLGLAFEEWCAIDLPAVAVADPTTGTLLEPFRGVDEFLAGTGG